MSATPVHFAYNEYNVQDTDKSTLQKQATWLNRYPQVQITIEGHAGRARHTRIQSCVGCSAGQCREAEFPGEFWASIPARLQTVSYGQGTADLHRLE